MKNENPGRHFLICCLLITILILIAGGCALVKPTRYYDESTSIDWGLAGAFDGSAVIVPFTAQDPKWGIYAAQRMKEYLLEEKAFKRVIYSEENGPKSTYVIKGSLDHISYGGTDTPTIVFINVRVIATADGQTRFLRTAKASSEKSAYHMTMLRRLFIPAPYPEEVMNGVLKHIAHDIALRSKASPAIQNP
jgi:hypothetical protein